MRLKKCLTSLLAILISTIAFCCGPYWNYPHEYLMYKVIEDGFDADEDAVIENCRLWQKITSSDIPVEDIREVVYDYSLDKLEKLLKRRNRRSSNAFVKWIAKHKDKDIQQLLCLARWSEIVREKSLDKWYYPYEGDEVRSELSRISTELGFAMPEHGRLYDRYALQKARVLFSLGRYEEIISWWEIWEPSLQEDMIRDMILGYLAGSYYRIGQKELAIEYYTQIGDYESIAYCLGINNSVNDTESYLDFLAEYCPDGKKLPYILQKIFTELENRSLSWEFSEADYQSRKDFSRLSDQAEELYVQACLKAAESPKCSNPAIWYYSAAFVCELSGNLESAANLLSLAETAAGPENIKESVRIFRMYLDAKTSEYNDEYKAKLFKDLEWLDGLISTRITDRVREITEDGYDLKTSFSYYYWNDMLRRIVIGEVVPRLRAQGDDVLALRLLNMADNRLLSLVDSHSNYSENGWEYMSMQDYRNNTHLFNDFDYSNYFFKEMDSMDIELVIQYALSALSEYPKSEFDSFLDARGYIDKDYLYELIGTRYLRGREYQKAAFFLSQVSSSYQAKTNINAYTGRNPFEYNPTVGKPRRQYKLSFARKMADYQNVIQTLKSSTTRLSDKDYDKIGEAMVYMGIGLRSSFDFCWVLTQYSCCEDDQWYDAPYRVSALEEAKSFIDEGLAMIRDHELAAQLNVKVCRWRTAATKYADSITGQKTRSGCDKLTDYSFSIGRQSNNWD